MGLYFLQIVSLGVGRLGLQVEQVLLVNLPIFLFKLEIYFLVVNALAIRMKTQLNLVQLIHIRAISLSLHLVVLLHWRLGHV